MDTDKGKYPLLQGVDSPSDIKDFDLDSLKQLCEEIRLYMIDCCSRNPGHLASSLGAVELITGLHYVFDTPADKIVFDVGHQAYAHKILTGRREAFATMRTAGGISGFPRMAESPYDAFGAGHSSTSVSAAFGLAEAARLSGSHDKVVALIGDGALTGGLALEALNNSGASGDDLLIILNDNNQSIDGNLGALHNHLLRLTAGKAYNKVKDSVWHRLGESKLRRRIQRWMRSFKSWLVRPTGGDFFESLGIRYFGPIDGNDMEAVVQALTRMRTLKGPRILHCYTKKGKGYAPAEADPTVWHAPGKFNPETGERIKTPAKASKYQEVFGQTLIDLAEKEPHIVGITPAMASGCGMTAFAARFPERFFDVGIEEEHAVTFSAGLAAGGMIPFCNIYSSFSQRAYDQIIHDVALQGLHVVLCFDRAGLVGEDGATHHGIFDLSAYRSIPGTTIVAPRNERELRNAMYSATLAANGPYIIRYPRGEGEGTPWKGEAFEELECGKAEKLRDGSRYAILSLGACASAALEAASRFEKEGHGSPAVWDVRFLKPLDQNMIRLIAKDSKAVITVEDGCLKGGLYGAVCEELSGMDEKPLVMGLGIPDRFIGSGSRKEQEAECGIDADGIFETLCKVEKKF